MRISNKTLTAKVKLVLLVVNSVKLHLTAFLEVISSLLMALMLAVILPLQQSHVDEQIKLLPFLLL